MKVTKYYCDLCNEENKEYKNSVTETFQHGEEFVPFTTYLKEIGYVNTHYDCMLNRKQKVDSLIKPKKKD